MKGEVSELLKPRYKMIAPYPRSDSDGVHVGDILTDDGKTPVRNQHGDAIIPFHWEIFPHIFKPLAWYEEREASEMPEYVRGLGKVLKVISWQMDETGEELFFRFEGDDKKSFVKKDATLGYYAHDFLPATETEYNQYISKTQTQEQ